MQSAQLKWSSHSTASAFRLTIADVKGRIVTYVEALTLLSVPWVRHRCKATIPVLCDMCEHVHVQVRVRVYN